jgi:hypothetical protein
MSFSRVFAPLCAAFLGLVSPSFANPLDAVDEDDREALEAFAVYPEDVRDQALEVATEPGVLVELQDLQDDSQKTFRDLLDPYAQSDQEQLFELSRYPDLVEAIARGGPKSRGELERIAADYPEEARAAAVRQGGEHHRVVSRMHALLEDFDHRFAQLIEDLSPSKQRAFQAMLRTPELLSLMSEHTQMTVLLGDAFERDPADVREALADLNLEVARRNTEEADDWKRTVDSDPDLRRDYDSAAADYRRDTGYDAYQPRTVVNVSVNPYPYWFGYPWWYPVSYTYYDPWYWWYPRRIWGHCGYSYGPRVVFYGGPIWRPYYPSYHFTSWYFSFGHHHHHYPYLSDRYVSFYDRPFYGHRGGHHHARYYNVHKRVVNKFYFETERVMPAGYWKGGKSRKDRVERFREYGKIAPEIERVRGKRRFDEFQKERGKRPGRDFTLRDAGGDDRASRDEIRKIVGKNPKQFPELAKVKKEDWDRPRERDRDRDLGKRGGAGETSREPGGKRDAGPEPSRAEPKGGKGSGKDRAARPAAEPDAGKARGKDRPADAGSRGKRGEGEGTGKARPSFERPGGESPKGGSREAAPRDRGGDSGKSTRKSGGEGGGKDRSGDRERRSKETKAAPSFDAPSQGGRERSQPKAERRSAEPRKAQPAVQQPRKEPARRAEPRQEAPRVRQQEPRSEPRVRQQEPRSEPRVRQQEHRQEAPRVERESRGGGGGGERQRGGGGGGGDGGGKKGKDREEEGNGGGGGGGGKRGR